jgi:hypothetical protein
MYGFRPAFDISDRVWKSSEKEILIAEDGLSTG